MSTTESQGDFQLKDNTILKRDSIQDSGIISVGDDGAEQQCLLHHTAPHIQHIAPHRRKLIILCACLFLFFTVAPFGVLASILVDEKSNYFHGAAHAATVQAYFDMPAGLLSIFFVPFIGKVTDHYGRRGALIFLALATCGQFICLMIQPHNMLLYMTAAAALLSLTGNRAGSSVVNSVISDVCVGSERSIYLGATVACATLGLVVGAGLVFSGLSHMMLYAACVGMVGLGVLVCIVCPESLHKSVRVEGSISVVADYRACWRLFMTSSAVRRCTLVTVLSGLPEQALLECMLYYLRDELNFTSRDNSILLTEIGIFGIITNTLVLVVGVRYFSECSLLRFSLVINALHVVTYAVAWNKEIVFFLAAPMVSFSLIAQPLLKSIASQHRDADEQGVVLGVINAGTCLTCAFGPFMFTQLYSHFKSTFHQAPFIACLVLVIVAIGLSFGVDPPPVVTKEEVEKAYAENVDDDCAHQLSTAANL
eukprot:PhM_4_TR5961/c0_g1_i2/m.3863